MVLVPPQVFREVRQRVRDTAQANQSGDFYRLQFRAMSTACRIQFRAATPVLAREVQAQVLEWTADFESRYSRFIPDSVIGQVNAAAGGDWLELDAEADQILTLCHSMVFLTGGAFDPAALPCLRLWNWKATSPRLPSPEAIDEARALSGWDKVHRRPGAIRLPRQGMGLDLGGIGKEYAVDQVLRLAREAGLLDVLVDFGQDIRVYGQAPGKEAWYIGLEDPKRPGQCWGGVAVTNHAVATSGDYFRAFTIDGRRYGHILDPRTGSPATGGCLSVSVVAASCVQAGTLSTAAFILGPKAGLDLVQLCVGAEASIVTETSRYQTRNFAAYALDSN